MAVELVSKFTLKTILTIKINGKRRGFDRTSVVIKWVVKIETVNIYIGVLYHTITQLLFLVKNAVPGNFIQMHLGLFGNFLAFVNEFSCGI